MRIRKSKIIRFLSKKSKGIISVLLAVVFIPFMFLGTTLVELVRYHSSARAVDQALASSELSALADYDPYLLQRFGLLAIDQSGIEDGNLGSVVKSYLDKQHTTDMAGARITGVSAEGVYALNDTKILMQQIQSSSNVLAPYNMAVNGLAIDSLIEQIDDLLLKAKCFDKMLDMVSSGAEVIDSEVDLFEKLEGLYDELKKVKDAKAKYDSDYEKWKDSVNALIDHLNDEPDRDDYTSKNPDGTEDFDESSYNAAMDEWNSKKADLIADVDNKKSNYSTSVGNAASAMGALSTAVGEAMDSLSQFSDKIESFEISSAKYDVATFNNEIDDKVKALEEKGKTAVGEEKTQIENEIASLNNTKDIGSNVVNVNSEIADNTKSTRDLTDDLINSLETATIDFLKNKLDEEKARVDEYSANSISSGSSAPSEDSYHSATDVGNYTPELLDAIKDQALETLKNDALEQLKGLVKAMQSLFKLDGIYSVGLNANISDDLWNTLPTNTTYSYDAPLFAQSDLELSNKYKAGMGFSASPEDDPGIAVLHMEELFNAVINSLESFVNSAEGIITFTYDITHPIKSLKQYLSLLKEVFVSVVTLVKNTVELVSFMTQKPDAILSMFQRRAVLMDYLVNTMPNRTTFSSGSTLTGYKYSSIKLADVDLAAQVLTFGGRSGLVASNAYSLIHGAFRQDKCFVGAELEYIMAGTQSEIYNQMQVFKWLYVFRLLLDVAPVLINSEVQQISNALAAVPYAGPFLKIIYIVATVFAEPFADCIVLVNGGDVKLIKYEKSDVYLTPSGITGFVSELTTIKIAGLTSQTDDTAQKLREEANKDIVDLQKDWEKTTGVSTEYVKPFANTKDPVKPDVSKGVEFRDDYLTALNERNYTEHCFILMLLLGSNDSYLQRTADIITMEKTASAGAGETFHIENAYTCIRAEATGSMVQVFPIPSLSSSSVLSFDRVEYRGY